MDVKETATASALRAACHRVVRRLNATADAVDLTAVQRGMMAELDLAGELSSADLARKELVSPQAANVAVAELLERGLVVRRTDPDDGRRRLVSLTDQGRTLIHGVRDDKNTWLAQRIESELTPKERKVLREAAALMQRLVDES